MKKPFLLRLLPPSLRQSVTSRFYLGEYKKWKNLYEVTPLVFCPSVSMHNLIPGDIISGNIAFNGFYELELTREIVKLGRLGGFFVDVGANMGYFSLLWAGVNSSNSVMAFEVAPRNIKLLQNNIVDNKFSDRVSLVPKAASYNDGQTSFDVGPADQTGWGGIAGTQSHNTITVPAVRLDNELSDTIIDVLKIDVEGADTWVLYGCELLLQRKLIRRIYFEQNTQRMDKLGIDSNEAKIFLNKLGYTCNPFDKYEREWVAFPTHNSIL